MAETKKPVATLKTAEVKADTKKEETVKAAEAVKTVETKTAAVKDVVKKAEAAKTEVKATAKKTAKKATETAKKAEKKVEKKVETVAKKATKAVAEKKAESQVYVQFAGKSFSNEELVKIAKDVWVYDMDRKAADFKTVDIYVKPEESMAYFVVNGKEAGSFVL